ncbi:MULTISPECIES: hypothetical protein [Vibrio]|uniref:hypothetical protein n=1 Tax=Vibrio TaxID=662 RepID=UPI0021A5EBB9|nr:hypothetical protein [Vibrio sp. LaRot3]MDA0147352.1 hypothetical protein [Vibrio sp. LaRot3]
MKVSEFKHLLNQLPTDADLNLVTGDEWLPERLIATNQVDDMLFLQFDNAPDEEQGEEEGRGFVEHEIELIRERFEQIIAEDSDAKSKADAILALFLMGHERSSSEIVELLEAPDLENEYVE